MTGCKAGFRKPLVRGNPSLPKDAADLQTAVENLRLLVQGLSHTLQCELPPLPKFVDLSGVKRFCSEALDSSPATGSWQGQVRALGARTSVSVLGSVFLFRKTLPARDPDLGAYVSLLTNPAPDPPNGFLGFCAAEVNKLFPVGWDSGYVGGVWRSTLSTSACREAPASRGGARGALFEPHRLRGDGFADRAEFVKTCLGLYAPRVSDKVSVMTALCDGKKRLVTVSPARMQVLKPLHDLLYGRLSKTGWLLRGEASPGRFAGFERKEGEVFVSGDYESATDNLNLDVARHILGCVMRRCSYVPVSVREFAVESLARVLVTPDGAEHTQRRGQLMGSLLSFPLLCLQNYLAFRYFVPRNVPVKINGDDIVFRATHSEFRTWADGVSSVGLKLSQGKTAVSSSWFSLNSTFFWAGRRGSLSLLPLVRSTQLFRSVECPSAIAGRLQSIAAGFDGPGRRWWQVSLLKKLTPAIYATQRSVVRGLGVRVPRSVLVAAGLWEREVFYLTAPFEPPLPPPRPVFAQRCVPEGWRKIMVPLSGIDHQAEAELESWIQSEMTALSWLNPPLPPRHVSRCLWDACREGTYSCRGWLSNRVSSRRRRLLQVSRRVFLAFLRCVLPPDVHKAWFSPRRRGAVWRLAADRPTF